MTRDEMVGKLAELIYEGSTLCCYDDTPLQTQSDYRGLAENILARLDSLGFCVVPKEATEEMEDAGDNLQRGGRRSEPICAASSEIYRAMISAAIGK